MNTKKCEFEGCGHDAKKGWRFCRVHIQVMYRRMLNEGYLEPWPNGEEPDCPQDLIDGKEKEVDTDGDGKATAA